MHNEYCRGTVQSSGDGGCCVSNSSRSSSDGLCQELLSVDISEKEEELESTTSRLNRQLSDVEFARSSLERQKSTLESELTASRQEVAGLKSTVAQMSAAQAGIEAELAATKVVIAVLSQV